MSKIYSLENLTDTLSLGEEVWGNIRTPFCVYFEGDLGTGKTTLCKAIIEAAGYAGPVTSPTYNLIQEYRVGNKTILHMDLYRLDVSEELEFLGLADLWNEDSVFLIEWAEKGKGYLPEANLTIALSRDENPKSSEENSEFRRAELLYHS